MIIILLIRRPGVPGMYSFVFGLCAWPPHTSTTKRKKEVLRDRAMEKNMNIKCRDAFFLIKCALIARDEGILGRRTLELMNSARKQHQRSPLLRQRKITDTSKSACMLSLFEVKARMLPLNVCTMGGMVFCLPDRSMPQDQFLHYT